MSMCFGHDMIAIVDPNVPTHCTPWKNVVHMYLAQTDRISNFNQYKKCTINWVFTVHVLFVFVIDTYLSFQLHQKWYSVYTSESFWDVLKWIASLFTDATPHHNSAPLDRLSLKKVIDMVNRGDDQGLRDMNRKLQRMLEETLTKNMHLQKVKIISIIILTDLVAIGGETLNSFWWKVSHYYVIQVYVSKWLGKNIIQCSTLTTVQDRLNMAHQLPPMSSVNNYSIIFSKLSNSNKYKTTV